MNGYEILARQRSQFQVFGANTFGDVERFQRGIVALRKDKQLPGFQPMISALSTQKGGYGTYGPTTKKAAAAFNREYGWPGDGEKITAGTIAALDRPDLKAGYVETPASATPAPSTPAPSTPAPSSAGKQSEVLDPYADKTVKVVVAVDQVQKKLTQAIDEKAAAKTPEQKTVAQAKVVEAQREVNTVNAQVQTSNAPPEAKAAAAQLTQTADKAVTSNSPAEIQQTQLAVKTVEQQINQVVATVPGAKEAIEGNFFTRQYGGLPVWGWGVIGVGSATLLGLLAKLLLSSSPTAASPTGSSK